MQYIYITCSLKLQDSVRKRATTHRALLQKMTYEDNDIHLYHLLTQSLSHTPSPFFCPSLTLSCNEVKTQEAGGRGGGTPTEVCVWGGWGFVCGCGWVRVHVCVCVWERERERKGHLSRCFYFHRCVCVRARPRLRVCVCVCVRERERKRERKRDEYVCIYMLIHRCICVKIHI